VSSHDTGRILTDLGGGNFGESPKAEAVKRLKLLSTLLYAIPGAPVIFQGDERGILGEKEFYDAHRYPIQWDAVDENLISHYKKLAQLRQEIQFAIITEPVTCFPSLEVSKAVVR